METFLHNSVKQRKEKSLLNALRDRGFISGNDEISKINLCLIILAEFPFFLTFGILFYLFSDDDEANCGTLQVWTDIAGVTFIIASIVAFSLALLIVIYFILDKNHIVLKIYSKINVIYKIFYIIATFVLIVTLSNYYFRSEINAECDSLYSVTFAFLLVEYILAGLLVLIFLVMMLCYCFIL
jgi:hypothetical protein